jgi:uncharacterized protein YbjQ (UPF0145 family)
VPEIQSYTQALYDARELALARMQTEAKAVRATGIVGADVHEDSPGWAGHVIEFFALGTAVASTSDEHRVHAPALVLPLID